MLETLELLGHQPRLRPFKEKLRFLAQRLSRSASQETEGALAIEFYAIIESHPILRSSSKVVFAAEVRDICQAGLEYWANVENQRQLTSEERGCLQVVRERFREANIDLSNALAAFLQVEDMDKRKEEWGN
jgi:hypothetical protein